MGMRRRIGEYIFLGVLAILLFRFFSFICIWSEPAIPVFKNQMGRTLLESTFLGSHNSLTYGWDTGATTFLTRTLGQTQILPICEQLKRGVRYFDVRVRWEDGIWYGYHTVTNRGVTYESALMQFAEFLEQHPREVIVMKVTRYDNFINPTFHALTDRYISRFVVRGSMRVFRQPISDIGKQIVWIDELNHDECLYDPFEHGVEVSTWESAYDHYRDVYSQNKPREGQLAVLQWIPSVDQHSVWTCLQNIQSMCVELNRQLLLPPPPRGRNRHNVVMIDFVC